MRCPAPLLAPDAGACFWLYENSGELSETFLAGTEQI